MSSDDPTDSELAALVGSRICHDLASPVGAALTGLEFLDEMGAGGGETELLRESLAGARATLDVLRLAFGRQGRGEAFDAGTLGDLMRAHLAARPRLRLEWALAGPISRAQAQRIALALLCTAHALSRGGTLTVGPSPSAGTRVMATGTITADPALWDGLAGRACLPAPDPRRIEFHLLAARQGRNGARAWIMQDADTLTLTIGPHPDD